MKRNHAQMLCVAYELGELSTRPQAVPGGLLHQMWRLDTTRGRHAVKQLNPAIMHKPGIEEAYRASERIALEMYGYGVPAIVALQRGGDPLYQVEGTSYLVYDWCEGNALTSEASEPGQARQMGHLLGQMHSVKMSVPGAEDEEWRSFDEEVWDMLTFHAASQNLEWAYIARSMLPRLLTWSRLYEVAGQQLGRHQVVSHRDLDQKNVLWRDDQTPHIIDWEAAGLINPTLELVGVALSWSGLVVGDVRKESFDAVIAGYRQTGGEIHNTSEVALHGLMGTWLGWLLFNMRRSLGESVEREEERDLGKRETSMTLKLLRTFDDHLPIWAGWLDAWR
ncbi:phosphotransferase [Ktedonobacter racemifer]|uniref:Aminoglycoside phosphotransferase n=1 Tax=Ktedonobacter racemifer DSM 44963 TaxID=485913 RepID=D6THL3_KTERA|nr:phosphotransferase [Ktedonobacter racemifer]EFH89018.1 aminoglycoside phosphotransferase [Ktedonobacter racemifer DSM 44963]